MKLSDALRGAADRAPVEQLRVSAADAAGRVRRDRRLRMGANGLVGAGAAAIVAVGAMGPIGAGMSAAESVSGAAMDASAEMYSGDEGAAAAEDSARGADGTRLAEQWMCGAGFDPEDGSWSWGDTSGVTFTAGEPEQADGTQVELPQSLEATRPVDLISSPDVVVTWDGVVVGRMVQAASIQYGPADEPTLPEGEVYERLEPGTEFETLEQSTALDAVNCWDGEPLPAADYEIHQAWTLAHADAAVDPSAAPVEPSAPEPGNGTSASPAPGVAEGSAGEGSEEVEILPVPATPELFRVAAKPVVLTIAGEQAEDPFADYLGGDEPVDPVPLPEPIEPEPLPEGHLTPDIARQLFESGVVGGAWDMAAGTQRWVKLSDSASPTQNDDWNRNYYGCSWDGSQGATFPATSAEISLLDVDVELPARIGVSYGFVVDDNPLVSSSVTNTSEYTIPGFWGAQPQLFLVRDGRVVAEGHPINVNERGMGIAGAAEEGGMTNMMIYPEFGGDLAPSQSISGDFLWRDVTGCSTDSGRGSVSAGTYTVLSMQTVSVSNQSNPVLYGGAEPLIVPEESGLVRPSPGTLGDGTGSVSDWAELDLSEPAIVAPDIAIAPALDQMDWVELQSWTSLGTITVSES